MNKGRVLIACEFSGTLRDAITRIRPDLDVWSCDILESEKPGKHYKGDVMDIIDDGWDAMIAFPPCTHLSSAGASLWKIKEETGEQMEAFMFVKNLWDSKIKKKCVENPVGWLNTNWMKPSQIIHPYYFGDPFLKRTCLWINGFPLLKKQNEVNPKFYWLSSSTRGGLKKDGTRTPSKLPRYNSWESKKERSRTFPGIAAAMAQQWFGGEA